MTNSIVTISGSHIASRLGCSVSSSKRMQQPTLPTASTAISNDRGVLSRRKMAIAQSGMKIETSGG